MFVSVKSNRISGFKTITSHPSIRFAMSKKPDYTLNVVNNPMLAHLHILIRLIIRANSNNQFKRWREYYNSPITNSDIRLIGQESNKYFTTFNVVKVTKN